MATTTQHGHGMVRSLRGFLADSAYAYVGLGGATVELVRSIDRIRVQTPQRARALSRQAPDRLRHLVGERVSSTLELPARATREFDGLARRGRDLVGAIRTNAATLQAVDRTRIARSRVKAAGTSIGKAAESTVQATERAATIVAARTEPTPHHDLKARPSRVTPPKAPVKTRRAAPGRQAAGRRTAAPRGPRATQR